MTTEKKIFCLKLIANQSFSLFTVCSNFIGVSHVYQKPHLPRITMAKEYTRMLLHVFTQFGPSATRHIYGSGIDEMAAVETIWWGHTQGGNEVKTGKKSMSSDRIIALEARKSKQQNFRVKAQPTVDANERAFCTGTTHYGHKKKHTHTYTLIYVSELWCRWQNFSFSLDAFIIIIVLVVFSCCSYHYNYYFGFRFVRLCTFFYTRSSIKFALSLRIPSSFTNLLPDVRALLCVCVDGDIGRLCILSRMYDISCFLNKRNRKSISFLPLLLPSRIAITTMTGFIFSIPFSTQNTHYTAYTRTHLYTFCWLLRFYHSSSSSLSSSLFQNIHLISLTWQKSN